MTDLKEMEMDEVKKLKAKIQTLKNKLKQRETFFESITERTLDGYWIWKIKENEMFISPQLKKMLGYEDSELVNSPETINKLMHPSDLPDTYALLGKHIESNGEIPFEIEVRYKHRNESLVWVICTGNIVERDESGAPSVMIGCHLDNTALKAAEGVQKYAEELEQKNNELEQFAFVASHDLQEPLNTIKGFINILNDDERITRDQEIATYLNHINNGANRMSSLIEGLLEYSRIGKHSSIAKVETKEILKEVIDDLTKTINTKKAKIKIGDLPSVMGYRIDLRILFQNLISNALKFTSDNHPILIEVDCGEDEDYYIFSVKDNGLGIEPKFSIKIFELYQRLYSASEYEGNGLGLAQCKKIVEELHKGKIWVEPNQKIGSSFKFTIPKSI